MHLYTAFADIFKKHWAEKELLKRADDLRFILVRRYGVPVSEFDSNHEIKAVCHEYTATGDKQFPEDMPLITTPGNLIHHRFHACALYLHNNGISHYRVDNAINKLVETLREKYSVPESQIKSLQLVSNELLKALRNIESPSR